LLDLFGHNGKHRKQLKHYLDDHIRHYRSESDRRVHIQTLKKTSQAVKEIENGIVT
jgi:hypothetical protein